MAKRLGQADIVELAGYKGRKMLLIEQAKAEQNAVAEQQEDEETRKAEAAQQANQESKNAAPGAPPPPSGPGF
jgi:hypothetical protein